jgi:hypothetical protein
VIKLLLLAVILTTIYMYPQNVREIQDNSFMIHEAYNQEFRVVQHIFTFSTEGSQRVLELSQEWPFFNEKHQLSFSLPYNFQQDTKGLSDLTLMYRYQLTDQGDLFSTAPAFSIIIPVEKSNSFSDKPGYQFLLPVSKRISKSFAAHINAAVSVYPNASIQTASGEIKKTIDSYLFGGSLIWLAGFNFNFMLEYLFNYTAEFSSTGGKNYQPENILNPGVRFAIDTGDLQIVPGIAVPVNFNNDTAELFLYLSFEHPF